MGKPRDAKLARAVQDEVDAVMDWLLALLQVVALLWLLFGVEW